MAGTIDLIESFDYYPADVNTPGLGVKSTWIPQGSFGSAAMTTGRFGGLGLKLGTASENFRYLRVIPSSTMKVGGYAIYNTTLNNLPGGNGLQMMQLEASDGTVLFQLNINNVGQLHGFIGATHVGQADRPIVAATWHYVEFEWQGLNSAGHFAVYIDGDLQFTFAGDTLAADGKTGDRFVLSLSPNISDRIYDDIYCKSGTLAALGEARIGLYEHTADFDTQFDPLTGVDNWAMIDDSSVDGDTTYNSSNTVGAYDLFTGQPIDTNPDTIHAVQLVAAVRKLDSGTRTIKQITKLGGTQQNGVDFNLASTYLWVRDLWEVNPNGDPWLKVDFGNLKRGYQVVL